MPLGTHGFFNDKGKPVYAKESRYPCPTCGYKVGIVEEKISARHTKFTCPQCSTQWEKIRAKPKPPPAPPKPTGPSYGSPADRADLAAESGSPELVEV